MVDGPITTSFIPKTRLTAPPWRGKGLGLGILISGFILFVSLALFGGVYWYKGSLEKEVNVAIESLRRAKAAFEPGLIAELSRLNSAISASQTILDQHQAPSKILKLIGNLALKDTVFSNFGFTSRDKKIAVTMAGEAKGYSDVALQAKIFEDSEFIDEVAFSNLSLKEGGRVGFNTALNIKPEFLIYKP